MTAVLILGGARSGKSAYAERLAGAWAARRGAEQVFVATAQALDAEMADRIARHRAERGARWRTVEAPRELTAALRREAAPNRVVLVDCLTLWLSNEMLAQEERGTPPMEAEAALEARYAGLIEALSAAEGLIVAVSNEVGYGLAPTNALGRAFRDAQGRLNQRVAAVADHAALVAAGLPLTLKGEAPE